MPGSITIDCPPATSKEGAFALSWSQPEAWDGEALVYRVTENQQLVYEGPETATTLTGRPKGEYQYLVSAAGMTSQPCQVTVAPPSLTLAFGLFAVGAAVFASTLAVIIIGHKRSERGQL